MCTQSHVVWWLSIQGFKISKWWQEPYQQHQRDEIVVDTDTGDTILCWKPFNKSCSSWISSWQCQLDTDSPTSSHGANTSPTIKRLLQESATTLRSVLKLWRGLYLQMGTQSRTGCAVTYYCRQKQSKAKARITCNMHCTRMLVHYRELLHKSPFQLDIMRAVYVPWAIKHLDTRKC